MLVELSHVQKAYAAPSSEVLRDVNFQVAAGEAVAIVGPSGSGKSTLLNIIGALDQPTRGTVRFDGRDLADLKEAELARLRNLAIGYIFQLHHLLPQCTILENVLIPTLADPSAHNRAAAVQRAEQLLERVGLQMRRDHRPGQLSGGERQRCAVVRALINRPKLLLADEPTGSLDHIAAENLARLLVELNQEERTALVVVTHSRELAGRMNRVLELQEGVLLNVT